MYMYMCDAYKVSVLPFLLGGNNFQSQILKRGDQKNNECLGEGGRGEA